MPLYVPHRRCHSWIEMNSLNFCRLIDKSHFGGNRCPSAFSPSASHGSGMMAAANSS
jgi:hypothetical protein